MFYSFLTALMLSAAVDLIPEPAPQEAKLGVPVPESFELASGLRVWVVRSGDVPMVTLSLVFRSGAAADPAGKEGLTYLTATMLDEGAGERGALDLAEEIDFLGASLAIDAEKEYTSVTVDVLRRNFDPVLDILADIVLRPRFEAKEWERVKALALNDLVQRREDPRRVGALVAERAFYGDGHPFSHPIDGYEESVRKIDLEMVKERYRKLVEPRNAVLIAVGDVSRADLEPRLEKRFGGWKGESSGGERGSIPPASGKPRLVLVDKPEAPQTVVRILIPAPPFGAPTLAPLVLANTVLGGTFTSRLVANLREEKGFTYGASSLVASRRAAAHVAATSSVQAEKTGPALVEFCREVRAMQTGELAADELRKARLTHWSRVVEALETQDSTLELYRVSGAFGLSPGERREFHERVQSATPEEIAAAARQVFRWDAATIVLVGDRRLIESQLADLRRDPPADRAGKPCTLPEVEPRGREGEALTP